MVNFKILELNSLPEPEDVFFTLACLVEPGLYKQYYC